LRDARVLLDTLDRAARRFRGEVDAEALACVRQALLVRHRAVRKWVLEGGGALAGVRDALRQARRRLKRQPLKKGGWSVVTTGLKKTYQDGLTAFDQATTAPAVEHLHEWRKRVKDLYHQLQFLRDVCPPVLDKTIDQVHKLADALGDDHDLAVLAQVLTEELQADGQPPVAEELVPLLRRWRDELQGQARELGVLIYKDAPGVFVARFKRLWKTWRAGRKQAAASC
jgi:CHAD domain-containing protein